jgi:hypothetical protein
MNFYCGTLNVLYTGHLTLEVSKFCACRLHGTKQEEFSELLHVNGPELILSPRLILSVDHNYLVLMFDLSIQLAMDLKPTLISSMSL